MTMEKNVYVYALIDENDDVVYIGTTNNKGRREQEHRSEGKIFSQMRLRDGPMTASGAKRREEELLDQYWADHGKSPKYNKDPDG